MIYYNKDEIKENLSLDQIETLVAELGGEPQQKGDMLICKTICHCGDHHKLYYYSNSRLFKCYTACDTAFDIFELVKKVEEQKNNEISLPQAVHKVANFFGIQGEENQEVVNMSEDWKIFGKYEKLNDIEIVIPEKQQLQSIDKDILKFFPTPHLTNWEQEGIAADVSINHGIAYNPVRQSILIPHYDIDFNLIGIRERTLIKEEEQYGKYKPAIIGGKMYNHPLGLNLYNLCYSKENIKKIKKAILWESEKSCLIYASIFGEENDITCACCGSSFISYQFELLKSLGVEEIIIGFDKQYKAIGDDEWRQWVKKLTNLHLKYHNECTISFLFDKENLLEYKMSPIDNGKEVFMTLFNNRIFL